MARYGTRTKCTRRITVGTGTARRSERNSAPLRWTISAFSFSTSTTARRAGTTHNGSKLALSRSARATRDHLRCAECTCGAARCPPCRPAAVRADSSGAAARVLASTAPCEIGNHIGSDQVGVGAVRGLDSEPRVVRGRAPARTVDAATIAAGPCADTGGRPSPRVRAGAVPRRRHGTKTRCAASWLRHCVRRPPTGR